MSKNFRLACAIELQLPSLTQLKMRKVQLGRGAVGVQPQAGSEKIANPGTPASGGRRSTIRFDCFELRQAHGTDVGPDAGRRWLVDPLYTTRAPRTHLALRRALSRCRSHLERGLGSASELQAVGNLCRFVFVDSRAGLSKASRRRKSCAQSPWQVLPPLRATNPLPAVRVPFRRTTEPGRLRIDLGTGADANRFANESG